MLEFVNNIFSARKRHFEYTSSGAGWFFDKQNVIRREKTKWQAIEVCKSDELGTTLLLDGITQLTEVGEFQYHEPMAHIPLLAHPNPKNIMVIGGGDGALVKEVLKHQSVEHLDFVELDEGVINFSKTYLPELGGAAFNSKKVQIHIEDGRSFVQNGVAAGKTYDVILMDMTDPIGPSVVLYTREFFAMIEKLLADTNALFIMHTESPDCRPDLFTKIHATLKPEFPIVRPFISHIRMYGGQWSWAVCSRANDIALVTPETIKERIAERKLTGFKVVSEETWPSFFTLWPLHYQFLAEKAEAATDANPGYQALGVR